MRNFLPRAIKSLLTLLVFGCLGSTLVNSQESLRTFTHEGQQLQVYPADHGTRVPWGPPNDASGATSSDDGSTNTQTITGKYDNWYQGNYAAKACADLNAFGYSDWYLPSRDELQSLFRSRNEIGGFSSAIYWSSTDDTWGAEAFAVDFTGGFALSRYKNEINTIRCVRKIYESPEEATIQSGQKQKWVDYPQGKVPGTMGTWDERCNLGVRGRVSGTHGMEGLRTYSLVVVTDENLSKIYGESTLDANNTFRIADLPKEETLFVHFLWGYRVWISEEIVVNDWVNKDLKINPEDFDPGGFDQGDEILTSAFVHPKMAVVILLLIKSSQYHDIYTHGKELRDDAFLFQRIHYLRLPGQWELHARDVETSLGELKLSGGGIIKFNEDGTGTAPMGNKFYWRSEYKRTGIIRSHGIRTGVEYHLVITMSSHEDFYESDEIFASIHHDGDRYRMTWGDSETFTKVKETPITSTKSGTSTVPKIDRQQPVAREKESGTFTDARDGQIYKWVRIGDQVWMAENLNVGQMINSRQKQINNGIFEKYCLDNDESNCINYGGLYQWDEMMQYNNDENQGICPAGWRIPAQEDWDELANGLGGIMNAGGKLKSNRTEPESHPRWNSPNNIDSQTTGFNALPSGLRSEHGHALFQLNVVYWWTSSEASSYEAPVRTINNRTTILAPGGVNKKYGLAVRCIKQ